MEGGFSLRPVSERSLLFIAVNATRTNVALHVSYSSTQVCNNLRSLSYNRWMIWP